LAETVPCLTVVRLTTQMPIPGAKHRGAPLGARSLRHNWNDGVRQGLGSRSSCTSDPASESGALVQVVGPRLVAPWIGFTA
jgi:hypothetical protein